MEITTEAHPEATRLSAQISSTLFTVMISTPTSASRQAVFRDTRSVTPRATQITAKIAVENKDRSAPTSGGAI